MNPPPRKLVTALLEFERGFLIQALLGTHGHRGKAAKHLGISRKTMWKRMKRLDIKDRDFACASCGSSQPYVLHPKEMS